VKRRRGVRCHPEPRQTARDLSNMVEGCELGCVISADM